MAKKTYQAKIYAKCGGSSIQVEVEANDSYSAKEKLKICGILNLFKQIL